MFLEVIAKSKQDVIDINDSLANRIELCKDLEVGGLTPPYDLIDEVTSISKIPVNVIVRPSSNSFVYSKAEKKQILEDIKFITSTKASGIVFGALTSKNNIDIKFLKKVLKFKKNLTITFHKAFDEVNNFTKSYKKLNSLEIDYILTSGGLDLETGLKVIDLLVNLNLKTKILIGGGINNNNISHAYSISNYIHIGRLARVNNSWDQKIDKQKINAICKIKLEK
ncbi:copper homeostasis protein [Spiroplasma corruscae]|uniref:Copper homeostasis protein cutC homolog n=1 Tax=Spiroplasma corruscae TaxID=216934 RepID=A0A222EN97_9MOLU|nr:copper homeostasis protein CutC [Spiroplasma corruscae]ASP27976.1 copper homeostasis protein [Spiroplasma corruscae]